MAITKIHPIKFTVNKAIAYVTNPKKTDEQTLVDYFGCTRLNPAMDFDFSLKKANQTKNPNKAFHLIQSFVPGETTPEEAHRIGQEMCDKLLNGKYTYVIGTHEDKHHIHNHIIFCAVDNIDFKKYNDCKATYKTIRELSDKLCREHNLYVIEEEKGIASSYKEWLEKQNGNSWKYTLKEDINSTIKTSKTYDDFIAQMRAKGYQIKGEKLDGSEGKYISFLCPGQEKWIRGKKTSGNRGLGDFYTREKINERIEKRVKQRADRIKTLASGTQSKDLIDTSQAKFSENAGLKKWADKENLKRMSAIYSELNRMGLSTKEALFERIATLEQSQIDTDKELDEIQEKMRVIGKVGKAISVYDTNKKYYNNYLNSKDQERYLENRISEITLYQDAEKFLKNSGIEPEKIDLSKLRDEYKRLEAQKEALTQRKEKNAKEIKTLNKYYGDLQLYMSDQDLGDKPNKDKDVTI